jgi:hypothetical protein
VVVISLTMFTAIRRASSFVSSLAAERRPGSSWKGRNVKNVTGR